MENLIKVTFKVGYEWIYDSDDVIDFDYYLTSEEFDKLVDIELAQLWNKDSKDWDYIRCFSPELFVRLKEKAIEEGYKEWGDGFEPSEYDYHYIFFIPDKISDAVEKRPEYKQLLKAKKRMQKISERRWHLEGKWIKNEVENGKWKGYKIDGIYSCGGMESNYHIDVGNISYNKYYTLCSHEVRIELYAAEERVQEMVSLFSAKYKKEITYKKSEYKYWILTYKSNEDNSDIKLFADIFDYMR